MFYILAHATNAWRNEAK